MRPNLVRAAGWTLASAVAAGLSATTWSEPVNDTSEEPQLLFAYGAPRHDVLAEAPRTALVLEARVKSVAQDASIATVVFEVERARRGRVDAPLTLRYHVGPSWDGSLFAVAGSKRSAVFPTLALFLPGEVVLLCVDVAGAAPGAVWRIGRFRAPGEPLPIVLADPMPGGNLEAFSTSR